MISIVIPVYCNEKSLEELFQRIEKVLVGRVFELIFIDDASLDESLSILKRLQSEDSRIRLISLGKNIGQHRAVIQGLEKARGEIAIVMDADLQDPPEAILPLLSKMGEGFEGVFACRKGSYESPLRLLQSKIFKRLLHFLCKVPVNAGMFVALSRRMIESSLARSSDLPFLVPLMGLSGLSTASIGVERPKRMKGVSSYSFYERFRLALEILLGVLKRKFFSIEK